MQVGFYQLPGLRKLKQSTDNDNHAIHYWLQLAIGNVLARGRGFMGCAGLRAHCGSLKGEDAACGPGIAEALSPSSDCSRPGLS